VKNRQRGEGIEKKSQDRDRKRISVELYSQGVAVIDNGNPSLY